MKTPNFNRRESGQTLIEAVVTLPIILSLGFFFFSLIYESFYFELIEHLLHESIICEQTLGEKNCLAKVTQQTKIRGIGGEIRIQRNSAKEYVANFYIFRNWKWKTIRVTTSKK